MSKTVKPFFARFLETEENADLRAQSEIKAGQGLGPYVPGTAADRTKKYPSDGDDSGNSGPGDWDYTK